MKKITVIVLGLLLLVSGALCANGSSETDEIKIGISPLALSNPFFVEMVNGAKAEAEKEGVKLVVSDNNGEPNKQITDLEVFISGGFDGFIVTAVDPNAVAPLAKEALDKGMSVIAHTSDLGAENQSGLVWAEEHDMGLTLGREAGTWAKEHIPAGETLQIAVLHYDILAQVIQRKQGILDGIAQTFPGKFEVVGEALTGGQVEGLEAGETWLQAYKDLDMIVSVNDGGALGAYQAVIAAGKNDADTFFVGGIDATDEALNAISEGGAYQATVDQQPAEMGALCVKQMVKAIKGEPFDEIVAIELAAVNMSNYTQFK